MGLFLVMGLWLVMVLWLVMGLWLVMVLWLVMWLFVMGIFILGHGFVSGVDFLEEGVVVGVASVSGVVMVSNIIVLWSIVSPRSVVCAWVSVILVLDEVSGVTFVIFDVRLAPATEAVAGAWLASVVVAIIASCVCVPALGVVVPITIGLVLVVVVSTVVSSRLMVALTMVASFSGMFVVVSGIEEWLVRNIEVYMEFWCCSTVGYGCWFWSHVDGAFLWMISLLVVVFVSGVDVDMLSRRTICVVISVSWGVVLLVLGVAVVTIVVLGVAVVTIVVLVLAIVVARCAMMTLVVVVRSIIMSVVFIV